MKPVSFFVALLLSVAVAGPVVAQPAQQDVCYRKSPITSEVFYDEEATKTWRGMVARQDNALMARLTGLWYAEIPNIDGRGSVALQYKQYLANGIWDYQSDLCTPGWPCSRSFGTGFWTAQPATDGSIKFMFILSDLERDHLCYGGAAWLDDADTLRDSAGAIWKRVKQQ